MLNARLILFPISRERKRKCETSLCCCQYICSVVIPAHFEVPENALPEVVDAEEAKRQLAVTTAVQWVNESMTEQLWGLIPFNQAEVDSRLR